MVTIVEVRAPGREDYGPERTRGGVARLRYVSKRKHWVLYWRDQNQKWHLYDLIHPSPDVLVLLNEVDRDPTCIFWGRAPTRDAVSGRCSHYCRPSWRLVTAKLGERRRAAGLAAAR